MLPSTPSHLSGFCSEPDVRNFWVKGIFAAVGVFLAALRWMGGPLQMFKKLPSRHTVLLRSSVVVRCMIRGER